MNSFSNSSVIVQFLKVCGDDWVGVVSKKMLDQAAKYNLVIPRSDFMKSSKKNGCFNLFNQYLNSACEAMEKLKQKAKKCIAERRKQFQSKGEIFENTNLRTDELKAELVSYHEAISILADCLEKEPPESLEEILSCLEMKEEDFDENYVIQTTGSDEIIELFDDEETRIFYENLPDIRSLIPSVLYKNSEFGKYEDLSTDQTPEEMDLEEDQKELNEIIEMEDKPDMACSESEPETKKNILDDLEDEESEVQSSTNVNKRELMMSFLERLKNLTNRDLIETAAIEFCTNLNTKGNFKILLKKLYEFTKDNLFMIPFYIRFVAIIHPILPSLTQKLADLFTTQFLEQINYAKSTYKLESKLRTVHLIGEMVKFRIYSPSKALDLLKKLLLNFKFQNIEMACCFLEVCGRFLYRNRGTCRRTMLYLQIMERKKQLKNFDPRYEQMVNNAYFYCIPGKKISIEFEKVPILERFLRSIVWKNLEPDTLTGKLKLIRKLDWSDPEVVRLVEKIFSQSWNAPYDKLEYLASLLRGLLVFHPQSILAIVENVLEFIKRSIEVNDPTMTQESLNAACYLGHLYNYSIVESDLIFKVLYMLISYGVSYNIYIPSVLDPPTSMARIGMVLSLLTPCYQYFCNNQKKTTLALFLLYFQRYYWHKRSLPIFAQIPKKEEIDEEINEDDLDSLSPYKFQRLILSKYPEYYSSIEAFPIYVINQYNDFMRKQKSSVILADSLMHINELIQKFESQNRKKINDLRSNQTENNLSSIPEGKESLEEEDGENLEIILKDAGNPSQDLKRTDSNETLINTPENDDYDDNDDEEEDQEEFDEDDEDFEEEDEESDEDEENEPARVENQEGEKKLRYIACEEDLEFQEKFNQLTAIHRLPVTIGHSSRQIFQSGETSNTSNSRESKKSQPVTSHSNNLPSVEYIRNKLSLDCVKNKSDKKDSSIRYGLIAKKSNKSVLLPIDVPKTVGFVLKYEENSRSEMAEKNEIKKRVLMMHQAQMKEDNLDSIIPF